jgi:hypothetical protein
MGRSRRGTRFAPSSGIASRALNLRGACKAGTAELRAARCSAVLNPKNIHTFINMQSQGPRGNPLGLGRTSH